MKGKLMNLLPFAHFPLYTIFAPKRLHNHWVLQSSQEKLKIKSLCKILGGKQGVSWEMCNWRMEIQNRKKVRGGKWEGVYFFPFPFPSSPTRFFFPHPRLPSTTTQRGGSNRTLGAKDFSSANSLTFAFFTPKHPVTCEKKPLVPRVSDG